MRLIIYSILEYNEMLIYYLASQRVRWVGIIILEYNDIIGENRISELYFDEKKGDPKVPKTVLQLF